MNEISRRFRAAKKRLDSGDYNYAYNKSVIDSINKQNNKNKKCCLKNGLESVIIKPKPY